MNVTTLSLPARIVSSHPLAIRWKLFVVLFILVAIAVTVSLSSEWLTAMSLVSLTPYGAIVILRKMLQLTFARASNRRQRDIVRTSIIDELVRMAPHLAAPAHDLLARPMHYDDFKAGVMALLRDLFDYNELNLIEQTGDQVRFDLNPSYVRTQWVDITWRQLVANSFGKPEDAPYVGVVIPTYRTSKLELQRLIDSLEDQTYPYIYVCIVLNEDSAEMKRFAYRLVRKYGGGKYVWFVEPRKGKRNAMRLGFADLLQDSRVKYIFNVDSDSRLHPDAVANAVRIFESDPKIGCLTGDIRVANPDVNLLTRLTYQRYYFAFNVERAAQSFWDDVTCMSGPFMGIRSTVLRGILHEWSNQQFLGALCNYGDDRHISTLVLRQGLKSVYSPDSIAWTDVPEKLSVWKRQQTRWARSACRETLITLPWIHRLSLWTIFDVAYLTLFPFILWVMMLVLVYRAMEHGPDLLLPYLAATVAMTFCFHSLYGLMVNKDFRYLLNPLYLIHQFIYLQPLRIWALISLDETGWGTK